MTEPRSVNREMLRKRRTQIKALQRRLSNELATIDAALMRVTETGKRSRKVIPPCGTETAYQRHYSRGEPPDAACKAAHATYNRSRELIRLQGERNADALLRTLDRGESS